MNTAGTFTEILVSAMIVVGAAFALIGSWGLVRLPTLMERLHGPTKATTLGLGGMLVASVLFFQLHRGSWSTHELLITLFLFITAPISANLIAKVHLHRLRVDAAGETKSPAGCPPTPPGAGDWATYEAPQPGSPTDTSTG
jgi:multicomponent K+:H+ antiporter subunit G